MHENSSFPPQKISLRAVPTEHPVFFFQNKQRIDTEEAEHGTQRLLFGRLLFASRWWSSSVNRPRVSTIQRRCNNSPAVPPSRPLMGDLYAWQTANWRSVGPKPVCVSGVNRGMTRAELFGQVAGCNRIATASSLTVDRYIFSKFRILYRFIAEARMFAKNDRVSFCFDDGSARESRSVNSVALCACRAMALPTRNSASVRVSIYF